MAGLSQRRKALAQKTKHLFQGKKPDNWFTRRFGKIAQRFGLPFGIFLAILSALLLTTVSMALYFASGTAKLDLSRPGYETARTQINRTDGSNQNFSSNGELDGAVIKDFLKKYDRESKDLQQCSSFNENILDDTQLGITTEATAPSDGANPSP